MNQKTINIIFAAVLIVLLVAMGVLMCENKSLKNGPKGLLNLESPIRGQVQNERIENDKTSDDVVLSKKTNNSDYEIFVNTKGGYQFEHAKDWRVEANGSTSEINGGKFASVGVFSFKGTINAYLDYLLKNTEAKIISKENVTINGLPATKLVTTGYAPDGLKYLINNGNTIVGINLSDGYSSEDLSKLDIVLNSFEFIK